MYTGQCLGAYYKQGGDSMQTWRKLKTKVMQTWETTDQKVLVLILLGLALLAGMGLGIYRNWPQPEQPAALQAVGDEEMKIVVQAQVERVIAELYPWVQEDPAQLAVVEPPSFPAPSPAEARPEPEEALIFENLSWPVQGEIQIPFGWYRHPVYGDWRFNAGIQFRTGEEAVCAVLAGQVAAVSSNDLETELVIDHGGGWSSTYRSVKGLIVMPGERVGQNQEIGLADDGIVFFGLTHNHEPVNPQAFLR